MSDYLGNLIARSFNLAPVLLPRLTSLYEPNSPRDMAPRFDSRPLENNVVFSSHPDKAHQIEKVYDTGHSNDAQNGFSLARAYPEQSNLRPIQNSAGLQRSGDAPNSPDNIESQHLESNKEPTNNESTKNLSGLKESRATLNRSDDTNRQQQMPGPIDAIPVASEKQDSPPVSDISQQMPGKDPPADESTERDFQSMAFQNSYQGKGSALPGDISAPELIRDISKSTPLRGSAHQSGIRSALSARKDLSASSAKSPAKDPAINPASGIIVQEAREIGQIFASGGQVKSSSMNSMDLMAFRDTLESISRGTQNPQTGKIFSTRRESSIDEDASGHDTKMLANIMDEQSESFHRLQDARSREIGRSSASREPAGQSSEPNLPPEKQIGHVRPFSIESMKDKPVADKKKPVSSVLPEPTIKITIGRIDVRAIVPQDKPKQRTVPKTTVPSLDDYLQSRNGGSL
ncbi:Uncharacterised protein [uncultured archaeon]|nr:Uncharacterised protein [uncultured archaeon]